MRRAAFVSIAAGAALLIGAGLALAISSDQLVHVNRDATPGDASALITPNAVAGDLVAFSSSASNLPGANGDAQAYVRDTATGTTTLVSTVDGAVGWESANEPVSEVAISGNGRYVVYSTPASNLVADDTNLAHDVFRYDLVSRATVLVSEGTGGGPGGAESRSPSISADGTRVAFWSEAEDLVSDDDNGMADAFAHDIKNDTMTRVSVTNFDGQGVGETEEEAVEISADGTLVAFTSYSNLIYPDDGSLPPGANDTVGGTPELYVRSIDGSVPTELVSRSHDASGADGGLPVYPSLSSDGRYVAFQSDQGNLVPGVSGSTHTFVRDRVAGTTELAGRADGASGAIPSSGTSMPSISDDGRFVGFHTDDIAINPGGSALSHVHVRDRVNNTTTLISRGGGASGTAADDNSRDAALAPAGGAVAFVSDANNLAGETGADDDVQNVFLRGYVPVLPTSGTPAGPPPATTKPLLTVSSLKLTPSKFRPVRKGKRGGGSKLRITLSAAATVTASVERQTDRAGKRFKRVGRITFKAKEGATTVRFNGVIKRKALKPGRYRIVIGAESAAATCCEPSEPIIKFVVKK